MSAVGRSVLFMEPARLLDEIAVSEGRIRAEQAQQLRLIAEFGESQRGGRLAWQCEETERATGAEVAGALGVSFTSAMLLAGSAETLVDRLPAVLAALSDGRIGLYAAKQLAGASDAVARELLTPDVDEALALESAQLLPGQVRSAADARLSALDPAAAAARAEAARARCDVWTLPKADGVASFGATLPAEQALACWDTLDSQARGLRAAGDERAIAQIMCDTLVERVTGAARAGRAAAVELQVVITDQALLGVSDDPATLVGHGPIPAGLAVQLSAETQAWVRRLLTDPVTAAVETAEAKRRRFFAGAARDLVKLRDRRCRSPFCDAPIRDVDHRVEHSAGGKTETGNADGYCQRCHHLKDHADISVTRVRAPEALPDAHRIAWRLPSGRTYQSIAPPALGHGSTTVDQVRQRRRLLDADP
jgi:Domain of unknown function (DUF222)